MVGYDWNRFPDLSAIDSLGLAEGLKCGICLNVFANAVDTRCGHTFCGECLRQWLSSLPIGRRKECPECRHPLAASIGAGVRTDKSRRVNAMVDKLRISCDNERNGCPNVCPLAALSGHLKSCRYRVCRTCGSPHKLPEKCKTRPKDTNELMAMNEELATKLKTCEEKALFLELKCKLMESLHKDLENKCHDLTTKTKVMMASLVVIIISTIVCFNCFNDWLSQDIHHN